MRCANGEYDAAAAVLADIDSSYLQKWGHYRLAAEMHERLVDGLTSPHWQMMTASAGQYLRDLRAAQAGH